MRLRRGLAILALTSATAVLGLIAAAAPDAEPEPPRAKDEDVRSMDAILAAVYDVISGPGGQERDWDRLRSLFIPGARLIPVARPEGGAARARVLDVEEFIKVAAEGTKRQGFFESEVARRVEHFGAITHVFSTYESTREKGGTAFDRGINSIQLLDDGTRWWIVTIYWDRERPGAPIPADYLPKK